MSGEAQNHFAYTDIMNPNVEVFNRLHFFKKEKRIRLFSTLIYSVYRIQSQYFQCQYPTLAPPHPTLSNFFYVFRSVDHSHDRLATMEQKLRMATQLVTREKQLYTNSTDDSIPSTSSS